MVKLTIKVKNDNCSMTFPNLEVDSIVMDSADPILRKMIEECINQFNQPVDDVLVTARMEA